MAWNTENSENPINAVGSVFMVEDLSQVNPQLYEWLGTVNEKSSSTPNIPQAKEIVKGKASAKTELTNGEKVIKSKNVPAKVSPLDKYSYRTLTEKDDMPVTKLSDDNVYNADGKIDRAYVIAKGVKNCRDKNNSANTGERTFVFVPDLGENILVNRDGLRHGLSRNAEATARVTMQIADILESAVVVNEIKPRDTSSGGYVLLGMASDDDGNLYPVRIVVNHYEVENVEALDVLYAVRAKKKSQSSNEAGSADISTPLIKGSSSTISIADLLNIVKDDFSDVLSGVYNCQ